MKKQLIAYILLLICTLLQAQKAEIIELNTPLTVSRDTTIVACKYINLKPGFRFTAVVNKGLHLRIGSDCGNVNLVGCFTVYTKDKQTSAVLNGGKYRVTDSTNKVIGDYTVTNGSFSLANLIYDTYKITELAPSAGYIANANSQTLVISDVACKSLTLLSEQTVVVPPVANDACFTVYTKDKQTNAVISSAKYRITDTNNKVIGDYISTDGSFTLSGLAYDTYTITETSPSVGYIANTLAQNIVLTSSSCETITLLSEKTVINPIIPTSVSLSYTEDNGASFKGEYTGVRVGEYYWMNTAFKDHINVSGENNMPTGWEWRNNPITKSQIDLLHQRFFMFEADPSAPTNYFAQLGTGTEAEKLAEFNKYYGTYHTRLHIDWMSSNKSQVKLLEGGDKQDLLWHLPSVDELRQLLGMTGNATMHEVRQYLSYGYDDPTAPSVAKISPKAYFDWFAPVKTNLDTVVYRNNVKIYTGSHGFYPEKTNIYKFNLVPSGSRFNGVGNLQWTKPNGERLNYSTIQGDFNGLNQTASMPLDDNYTFALHDYPEIKPQGDGKWHWRPIRWCRALTDLELGYKLYINVANYKEGYNFFQQLYQNHINGIYNVEIIRKGLNESVPTGFYELPKGYLRGFYVQYKIQFPDETKAIADILKAAQQNPYLWPAGTKDAKVNVAIEEQASTLRIYPNPVQDQLTIETSEAIVSMAIYNSNGKLILKKVSGNTADMSQFSSGMYIVKVQTDKGTHTHKVIKQ